MGGHIVKSIRRIAGLLIAMTALAFLGAGSASATEFPPAVGNGGSPFRDLCPAGQYLVGTNAHTGAVIDQISITCAPLKADGMVGVLFHGPTHGGPGGGTPKEPGDKNKERRTTCADNEIVNAMGLLPGEQNSRQVVRLIVSTAFRRRARPATISTSETPRSFPRSNILVLRAKPQSVSRDELVPTWMRSA